MSQKRITKELAEIHKDPPPGVSVSLQDGADLHKWEVLMDGPPDSPYAGGHFKLLLNIPSDFPFKPPQLNFQTKIYHPNVTNDGKGALCLAILKPEEWKPSSKISAILNTARSLLIEPNPDDAVESSIADQYKNNGKEFEKIAKDWTKKYAK